MRNDTKHLLSSPRNGSRLRAAIAQLDAKAFRAEDTPAEIMAALEAEDYSHLPDGEGVRE